MKDELDRIREEYFAIKRAERKVTEKKVRAPTRCSLCGETGHNRSRCFEAKTPHARRLKETGQTKSEFLRACSNSVWGGSSG